MSELVFGLGPFALFGVLSALLSTLAYLPYIRDTACGYTRPQRASWFIWSVLSMIAFGSQLYEGATTSLWFAGAQVLGTVVIFLMSLSRGTGSLVNRQDCVVILLAAFGLVAWYWMETAIYALAITISVSLLGGAVTIAKAYRDPNSETYATWAICGIASVFAIASVGRFDPVLLAYPMYLLILNVLIISAMMLGRAHLSKTVPAE